MKSNKILKNLAYSGVMAALMLAGCGGGSPTSQEPSAFEKPSFIITNLDAVTAVVSVSNTGPSLEGVQVIVSTLGTVDTSSDGSVQSASTPVRGTVIYNSGEDATSVVAIATGGRHTFALKNVSFALASSDMGSPVADGSCNGTADTSLGEVLLEVLSQEGMLRRDKLTVCALKGQTYAIAL